MLDWAAQYAFRGEERSEEVCAVRSLIETAVGPRQQYLARPARMAPDDGYLFGLLKQGGWIQSGLLPFVLQNGRFALEAPAVTR